MTNTTRSMDDRIAGSIPAAARRFGLGVKLLRRRAREGAFPVYSAGTARPRVVFAEVERWLRSTRVEPTAHAERVVAEQLERERARRKGDAR